MHVGTAAAKGDEDAQHVLVQYADNVALGLAGLANIFDPEAIVIAGGLVELGPLLFGPLARRVRAPHRGRRIPAARSRSSPPSSASAPARSAPRYSRGPSRRDGATVSVRIGLTLPSFVDDPEIPIAVARAAEAAELDAVFVYDHLWRGDPPNRRPALECFTLLGAVAAETRRIAVGTLVARATLRPPATLANAFTTVQRVSDGRLLAAIGAGDAQSRAENEAFGLEFGTMAERIAALHDAVRACADHGYPGVGRRARRAGARDRRDRRRLERWGVSPEEFAGEVALVREVAPGATLTWGGLARPIGRGRGGAGGRGCCPTSTPASSG